MPINIQLNKSSRNTLLDLDPHGESFASLGPISSYTLAGADAEIADESWLFVSHLPQPITHSRKMSAQYTATSSGGNGEDNSLPSLDGLSLKSKSNALSNKITSVLSASYADSEIRNALALLDKRGTTNTAETRRNMRLDAQKELIDCNVAILDEFGLVAEVSNGPLSHSRNMN